MFKFVRYALITIGVRDVVNTVMLNTFEYYAKKNPTGIAKKYNTAYTQVSLENAAKFHVGTAAELREELEKSITKYDIK